jgi:hypothetical protein
MDWINHKNITHRQQFLIIYNWIRKINSISNECSRPFGTHPLDFSLQRKIYLNKLGQFVCANGICLLPKTTKDSDNSRHKQGKITNSFKKNSDQDSRHVLFYWNYSLHSLHPKGFSPVSSYVFLHIRWTWWMWECLFALRTHNGFLSCVISHVHLQFIWFRKWLITLCALCVIMCVFGLHNFENDFFTLCTQRVFLQCEYSCAPSDYLLARMIYYTLCT